MGASASMALRNEAAKPHDASDIASDTAAVAEVTKLRQRLRRTVQSQMRTMEPPALVGIAESLTSAGAYIGAERALRLALVKAPTDVAIFQKYQHFVHSLDAGERLSSAESSSQIETLTASSSCPTAGSAGLSIATALPLDHLNAHEPLEILQRVSRPHWRLSVTQATMRHHLRVKVHGHWQSKAKGPNASTVSKVLGAFLHSARASTSAGGERASQWRQKPRRQSIAESHVKFGTLLELDDGCTDAAETHYRAALQLNPQSANAYYQLGRSLLSRIAVVTEEIAALEAKCQRSSMMHSIHRNAIVVLRERVQRLQSEVVVQLTTAVELDPNHAGAVNSLAFVRHNTLDDRVLAEEGYRAAIALAPEVLEYRFNLAYLLQEEEDAARCDAAVGEYQRIVDLCGAEANDAMCAHAEEMLQTATEKAAWCHRNEAFREIEAETALRNQSAKLFSNAMADFSTFERTDGNLQNLKKDVSLEMKKPEGLIDAPYIAPEEKKTKTKKKSKRRRRLSMLPQSVTDAAARERGSPRSTSSPRSPSPSPRAAGATSPNPLQQPSSVAEEAADGLPLEMVAERRPRGGRRRRMSVMADSLRRNIAAPLAIVADEAEDVVPVVEGSVEE